MKSLDDAAKRILRFLQRDGRATVQDVAKAAGLSTTPCWRRIKQLEAEGVIEGYAARLDRQRVGLDFYVLAKVSLNRHVKGVVEPFERAILAMQEVVECAEVTGDADYMLKILVADVEAYNRFLHKKMFAIPGLANVQSSVVLREVKKESALPI